MTPKEKANELIKKFEDENYFDEISILDNAKRNALLCVDEILNDNPNIYDSDRLNHKYWKEVKRQISLL